MLRVRVLGPLTVERDGATIALPAGARVQGLLGWLALHPGPQPRAVVAARLWPEVLDASARASLRTAVWELRKAAGTALVRTSRDEVELVADWVDLQAFAAADPAGALALVRGELLAGLEEEWVHAHRDEQRRRTMEALAAVADRAEAAGDLDAAVAADRRRTLLDPLAEAPCRDLIRRLAAAGDRAGALRAYATLRDRMRRELGLSPAAETRAAMEAVRAEPGGAPAAVPGADAGAAPADRAAPARATRGRRSPPFVGRDRELAVLEAALARAEAGEGGAVLITGEGGIGKTRLARELLATATARGARTATGAALELGGAPPFGLWAELLGELARGLEPRERPPAAAVWPQDVARLSPVAAERLGEPAGGTAGAPDFQRARLLEGVAEMVTWAARSRPLVVLLDDVHLADTASLEVAAYLARRIPELPVLLLLTRRAHPASVAADQLHHVLAARDALHAELALEPLGARELARLVRAVAPLGSADVERLVAASDGNALLAVEAARAAHAGTPGVGLRSVVAAATGRLAPGPREVAELAAAAGRELSRAEVARLDARDVAAAIESDLVDAPGGRLGYRHQLLRAAVYDALPEHRRAVAHDRLAGLLDASPAERGRHLRLAGRDEEAAAELERAGVVARRLGALTEADAFLREALELRPGDPGLLLELGDVAAWANRWEDAEAAVAAALAALDPGDAVGRARVHARRGLWLCSSLCAPRPAAGAYGEALALLDGHPEAPREALLDAIAGLAWAEGAGGDPERTDALLARLDELGGGDLPVGVRATAAGARGIALCRRGRFGEVYEPMLAAAAAHARAGAPDAASVALGNAACAAAFEHDWDRALALSARAGEYGRGVVRLEAQARATRAYVHSRLGRHAEALGAAREQLAAAERAGGPGLIAEAEYDLGRIALAAGRHEEAEARLASALARGGSIPRTRARIDRAEALALLGRAGEGERELRAATLEPVGPADHPATLVPHLARVQGLVALARGDRSLAVARLEEAAASWRARLARPDGSGFVVDLGRPPVAGLVEPDRELARVEAELAALAGDSVAPA